MANLLDLSTLAPERPTIGIDGTAYEMAVPADFGVLERTRIDRLQAKVLKLGDIPEDESDEDADERSRALQRVLTSFAALVLPDVPADVRDKLTDNQLLGIMQAFFTAAGRKTGMVPPTAKRKAPRSIGAKLSRVSNASTEDDLATG
jgi:hypothetical protein